MLFGFWAQLFSSLLLCDLDSRSTILNVMKGIKLKPPVWAVGVPEEVWMERILSRAGYRGPATANANVAAPAAASASSATTAGATEAEKARRKKKKQRALAKKAAAAQEGGDEKKVAAVDDFSPEFPPIAAAVTPAQY
jgi:hypothetical protein